MELPPQKPTANLRLKADLALLLVAVIWGSAFVAQRVAAPSAGVFLFNGLRFLLGAAMLAPLARRRLAQVGYPAQIGRTWPWLAAGGFLLFAAGGFQQAGLRYTTAGNAAFITGLYVVFVPAVLWLVFRQAVRPAAWAAAFMAVIGVTLLSAQGSMRLAPGDGLELAGAVLWAFHVIVVGIAVQRVDVLHFSAGQFFIAGLLNMAVGLLLELPLLGALSQAWWAVLYTGIFSVGIGYTLQAIGQKHAPPTAAAILLSMEAVFAALFGFFLLGERLNPIQLAGCALILAAIIITVIRAQAQEPPSI